MRGKLISDEGFEITFGHKSVYYRDSRGKFVFGYEDCYLFMPPRQIEGTAVSLSEADIDRMTECVMSGIRYEGLDVRVFHP